MRHKNEDCQKSSLDFKYGRFHFLIVPLCEAICYERLYVMNIQAIVSTKWINNMLFIDFF